MHQPHKLENYLNSLWLRLNGFVFICKAITYIPQKVSNTKWFLSLWRKSIIILNNFFFNSRFYDKENSIFLIAIYIAGLWNKKWGYLCVWMTPTPFFWRNHKCLSANQQQSNVKYHKQDISIYRCLSNICSGIYPC